MRWFFDKFEKIKGFRGGVLAYSAQGNPQIDEEIAKKHPFRPEKKNPARGAGRVSSREGRSSFSGRKKDRKGGWPKRLASRGRYSLVRLPGSLPFTREPTITDNHPEVKTFVTATRERGYGIDNGASLVFLRAVFAVVLLSLPLRSVSLCDWKRLRPRGRNRR